VESGLFHELNYVIQCCPQKNICNKLIINKFNSVLLAEAYAESGGFKVCLALEIYAYQHHIKQNSLSKKDKYLNLNIY
jgi:hypothetical protein